MASKGLGPLPRIRRGALGRGCGREGSGALPLPRAAAVSTGSRVRLRSEKVRCSAGSLALASSISCWRARTSSLHWQHCPRVLITTLRRGKLFFLIYDSLLIVNAYMQRVKTKLA